MGKIDLGSRRDLCAYISQKNLERQFSLLTDMVHVGLQVPFKVNEHIIQALHSSATVHLVANPGNYRKEDTHISGSSHIPCDPKDIEDLIINLIVDVHKRWDSSNTFELAAYVLWRLVWIHPFEDGNGRTARALSYLIICLKEKTLLFGSRSYLSIIRENYSQHYIAHLRHADKTDRHGAVDIGPLAELLAEIVKIQLESQTEM